MCRVDLLRGLPDLDVGVDLEAAVRRSSNDRLGVAGDRQRRVVRAGSDGQTGALSELGFVDAPPVQAGPRSACASSAAFARAWSAFV